MEVSTKDKELFIERKKIIESARLNLKNEFVGLNDIIDEILDLVEPWYLFPSGQLRPTVINLWGMTGVGKTSLVKRLFELIELQDSLYKFDVGDYASQDNNKLSHSFSEQLKNREKQQIGIIFDEFQLGRTINEEGSELEKSGLRAMWDLLDSGKISILQSSFYGTRIFQLAIKLEDCIENGGVESKNGIITKNLAYYEKYFKEIEQEEKVDSLGNKVIKNKVIENTFIPKDFLWYLQAIWETRFLTPREIAEHLKCLDHTETVNFLNETIEKAFKPLEFDYSSSCIFVIGNIDEAYKMSSNFDPDSDADRFYKNSLKITLPQIKAALKKRFRAEQIARLGNSHVLYRAFSSKIYKSLISMELEKSKNTIKERFNVDVVFENSIHKIIYKEGVFPTQGTRPVLTTIGSMINSYVGKIIKDIFEIDEGVDKIIWKFNSGKHNVIFLKNNNIIARKTYKVRLKIENLRKSDKSQLQAQVAIHEAGHAVAGIYSSNVLPSEIVSKTAGLSEGHCAIDISNTILDTKEIMRKRIILSLGGYVAEKIIFGENNISSGTSSDFENVSRLALHMAKSYAMLGGSPMKYGHPNINTNYEWNSNGVSDAEDRAAEIVNDCEKECVEILTKNKLLLLKLGEYLSINSRMDSTLIDKFVKDFGTPVEIKIKEDKGNFKAIISEKLKDCENMIS